MNPHLMNVHRIPAALVLAALVGACGGEAGTPGTAETEEIVVTGFSTPESVLHDPVADVYLVSNINGDPLDKDDNGFISRVSPEGEVLELGWIDGAAEDVTLNAPKGMAVQDSTLYVADIDCIRMFDRSTGAPRADVCLPDAAFLNDVASAEDGSVFFTDTGVQAGPEGLVPSGADAVYRLIDDERVVAVSKDPSLGGPNGIAVGRLGIMVVSFVSGEVYRLTAEGERTDVMPASERQLDGIEMLSDGGFVMSSWGDSAIYRIAGDGTVSRPIQGVEAPADIGYDATRNRVLVPLFNAGEVLIRTLG